MTYNDVSMTMWLAFPTSDHMVPDSIPAEGGILLMTDDTYCIEHCIITLPSSQYDLKPVERVLKHQNV